MPGNAVNTVGECPCSMFRLYAVWHIGSAPVWARTARRVMVFGAPAFCSEKIYRRPSNLRSMAEGIEHFMGSCVYRGKGIESG